MRTPAKIRAFRSVAGMMMALVLVTVPFASSLNSALAANPRLLVRPRSAQPGEVVHALGARFPAGAGVLVSWSSDGTPLGTATADDRGRFDLEFVVPDVAPGKYILRAESAASPEEESVSDKAEFEVESVPVIEAPPTETPTESPPTPTETPEATASEEQSPPATATDRPTEEPVQEEATRTRPTQEPSPDEEGGVQAAAASTTLTFAPDADAKVAPDVPTTNYGTSSSMNVDGSPQQEILLRFKVSGVNGTVAKARVRLYATNPTVAGPTIYATDTAWSETAVNWNSRPGRTSAGLATAGKIGSNVWVELDVTPQVTGNGTYSFVLAPNSNDGVTFSSRQTSKTDNRPQLVLTIDPSGGTQPPPAPSTPTPTPTRTPTPVSRGGSGTNPFAGAKWFIDPESDASKQAAAWRTSRPNDAKQMDKIAGQPKADWFDSGNGDIAAAVSKRIDTTAAQGALPVLVAYNILKRDCYGGGASSASAYRTWIRAFADGIGTRKAVVVLEPDALANITCLSSADQSTRTDLIKDAISVLEAKPGVAVYVDAGHANWVSASEMAKLLNAVGISAAQGFALNVSSFGTTSDNIAYGRQ
ncbi:MAG: endoglucanase, partial [Thermomicrobiales bacterium]|nr:endoglucanase [Thermomicrobiales bacterium]